MSIRIAPFLFVGLTFLVGCGKVKEARDRNETTDDLKELGLAYLQFQDTNGKPPRSFDELSKLVTLPARARNVTVIWGAGMGSLCRDGAASDIVVGYGPVTGGSVPVLFADGTVRALQQSALDTAPKAKPITR